MKVFLQSTTKIVDLVVDGKSIPARIWEGRTADGIRCHAFVSLIAADASQDCSAFDRELLEQKAPSPPIANYPASLIL